VIQPRDIAYFFESRGATHLEIARDLLALLCGLQSAATLSIDLGRAHARNPLWTAHARFHVAWQTANTTLLGLLEIGLLMIQGPYQEQRFYAAALLASFPMIGFFLALIGRKAYGGSLSDPNGIPPARVRAFGRDLRIDLNLAAVIMGMLALGITLMIYRF
jgi:hypothetical protein